MHVMAMPEGWRRLALADLPRERWRNGAGWTRPIASAEASAEAGGDTLWRVSLAEVSQAAPFSTFAGLDRTAVLAAGGPVRLRQVQGVQGVRGGLQSWDLTTPGDAARFPGEWALANEAPAQPALIWNVMALRGYAQAEVMRLDGQAWTAVPGAVCWAWVLRGSFALACAPAGGAKDSLDGLSNLGQLGTGEGLQVDATRVLPTLSPTSADASLLVTTVQSAASCGVAPQA